MWFRALFFFCNSFFFFFFFLRCSAFNSFGTNSQCWGSSSGVLAPWGLRVLGGLVPGCSWPPTTPTEPIPSLAAWQSTAATAAGEGGRWESMARMWKSPKKTCFISSLGCRLQPTRPLLAHSPPCAPALGRSPIPSTRGERATGTEHTRLPRVAHQEQPGWLSPGLVPPQQPPKNLRSPQKLFLLPLRIPVPWSWPCLGLCFPAPGPAPACPRGAGADVGDQPQPEVMEDPKIWVWDGCPLFLGAGQRRAWVSDPALVEKCGLRSFWSCSGGHLLHPSAPEPRGARPPSRPDYPAPETPAHQALRSVI